MLTFDNIFLTFDNGIGMVSATGFDNGSYPEVNQSLSFYPFPTYDLYYFRKLAKRG